MIKFGRWAIVVCLNKTKPILVDERSIDGYDIWCLDVQDEPHQENGAIAWNNTLAKGLDSIAFHD